MRSVRVEKLQKLMTNEEEVVKFLMTYGVVSTISCHTFIPCLPMTPISDKLGFCPLREKRSHFEIRDESCILISSFVVTFLRIVLKFRRTSGRPPIF